MATPLRGDVLVSHIFRWEGEVDAGDVEREGHVERYLADRLSGRERRAFELLWFESDEVFGNLEQGVRIRAAFAERDASDHPPLSSTS